MIEKELPSEGQSELTDEIKKALQTILEHCEREDQNARMILIKDAKQLDHFWNGLQHIFWDANEEDWRIPTHEQVKDITGSDDFLYDYVVNIFLPHGESIIAALTSDLPNVEFFPCNAEDSDDLRATKAATKLAAQISRFNESRELMLHSLFMLFTGHYVLCYNYYEKNAKYGRAVIDVIEMQDIQVTPDSYECPDCGNKFEKNEIGLCPSCLSNNINTIPGQMDKLPIKTGTELIDKGMEKLSVHGVLDVKLPIYAKDQSGCGYLIQYVDTHYAEATTVYGVDIGPSDKDDSNYERSLRSASIRQGYSNADNQRNLITVKRAWFRPWLFNIDEVSDQHDELLTLFPEGVRYSSVAKKFLEAEKESLDDHWTVTKSRVSRTVHSLPLGAPLVPIQEMRNTVKNLTIETLERGIASTFVDKDVLDFDKFKQSEVGVGQYYPVKKPPNSNIGDNFYETKSASLSKEVPEVEQSLDGDAQFVSGSFPSVYGGPAESGSKTLGEYVNSRNYALQRLSIPWQFISVWWGRIMYKSVNSYFKHQIEDDYFPIKSEGMYKNLWIRKADSKGKFVYLEPEVSEDFPQSLAQQKALLIQLFQLNNEMINQAILTPENAPTLMRLVGIQGISSPGELQVIKQLSEIEILIKTEPQVIPLDPMMMDQQQEEQKKSSVPIEPSIDDNEIHIRELTNFLIGFEGQDLKEYNPPAYENCLLHLAEHKQAQELMMMLGMDQTGKQPVQQQREIPQNA